jgi:hypothetical protein
MAELSRCGITTRNNLGRRLALLHDTFATNKVTSDSGKRREVILKTFQKEPPSPIDVVPSSGLLDLHHKALRHTRPRISGLDERQ